MPHAKTSPGFQRAGARPRSVIVWREGVISIGDGGCFSLSQTSLDRPRGFHHALEMDRTAALHHLGSQSANADGAKRRVLVIEDGDGEGGEADRDIVNGELPATLADEQEAFAQLGNIP